MDKKNFDKIFDQTILQLGEKKPTLLLHACCAPCATACLVRLLPHFDITLYFSNDNITDGTEFEKRLAELKRLVAIVNNDLFEVKAVAPLKLETSPLCSSNFFDIAAGLEGEKEGGKRCYMCFRMRLLASAKFAKSNNFDFFATTLTVSPHKNSSWLNEVGLQMQSIFHVNYLVSDFKKQNGYGQSVRLSNKYSIYRQHFCGCPFSNNVDDVK